MLKMYTFRINFLPWISFLRAIPLSSVMKFRRLDSARMFYFFVCLLLTIVSGIKMNETKEKRDQI